MKRNKRLAKSFACLAMALVSVAITAGSILTVNVNAATRASNSYDNALGKQMAAYAMSKCVSRGLSLSTSKKWSDIVESGDVFRQGSNVDVGPSYKNQILGEGAGDGSIDCGGQGSSVVRVFAEEFSDVLGDAGIAGVLCGANGSAGIVSKQAGANRTLSDECGTDGRYTISDQDTALARIQEIYDQWKNSSADGIYAASFDDVKVADFTDSTMAMLYYNDIVATCGTVSSTASDGAVALTHVNNSGQRVTEYITPSGNLNSTSVHTVNGYRSCNEMITYLNAAADEVQDTMADTQGYMCYLSYKNNPEVANSTQFKNLERAAWGAGTYEMFLSGNECKEINGVKEEIEESTARDSEYVYSSAEDPESKPCFNGSGELGWVLCTVIKLMRKTVDTLYDNVITPFLAIETKAFDFNSETYNGWKIFQNVANVAFVVFLLVIIFSQLTGYGIDNYGVKRMLPRLIVAAVLTNLSFIICQLLVDMSNILGVGLENMFEGMAKGVAGNIGVPVEHTVGATIITTAVGAGAAGGALATATLWVPIMILPLLLGLIGIIVSILMMFITLGARKAGAIILIVISPVAFVCYLLPNTKQYFDKWKKVFLAILLVYPICGMLMGGGSFAGALLWQVGGDEQSFVAQLLAALVTVIPFFFIPTVLRNSMAGLGNLGAKISGFGQRMAQGGGNIARMATQNAGWYKNMQDRGREAERNLERRRLEGVRDRIARTPEGARSERQIRQLALAQSALNKMEAEDVEAAVGVKPKNREDLMASATARRFQEDVAAIKDKNVNSNRVNNVGVNKGYIGDGSDLSFDPESMAGQLMAFAAEGNQEGIYAAVDQLGEKGHSGQEALRQVMSKLYAEGNTKAIKSISRAAMGNSKLAGDLKSGARTTYDYVKNAANDKVNGNINDFNTNKLSAKNYSEESFANMDAEELSRIVAELNKPDGAFSSKAGQAEADQIRKLATDALRNDLLKGGNKLEKRQLVEQISGQSFNVRQSGGGNGGGASGGGSAGAPGVGNSTRAEREAAADATGQAMEDIFEAQREG